MANTESWSVENCVCEILPEGLGCGPWSLLKPQRGILVWVFFSAFPVWVQQCQKFVVSVSQLLRYLRSMPNMSVLFLIQSVGSTYACQSGAIFNVMSNRNFHRRRVRSFVCFPLNARQCTCRIVTHVNLRFSFDPRFDDVVQFMPRNAKRPSYFYDHFKLIAIMRWVVWQLVLSVFLLYRAVDTSTSVVAHALCNRSRSPRSCQILSGERTATSGE
jgi:hypothetical protein